jgi:hypothetical protein
MENIFYLIIAEFFVIVDSFPVICLILINVIIIIIIIMFSY